MVAAVMAVYRAYMEPGCLVLVASPGERQSAEFVRKAAGFLRKLGIKPLGDGDNNVSLVLPNDSRIVGLPGTEGTIRGFSAPSLLIIDEASRVADEQYDAVLPMLSVSDGALWLMSTPRGKRGFFYEIWSKKEPEWRRVSVPATECPRIKPEILEWQRKAMGELMFSQEYMCQFIDIETSLFDRDRLLAAVREDVRPLW